MAQYNLSVLYLDGIHVPKNKKGLEYLKLAVAQNLGEAQYNMATLHEQGRNT